MSRNRTAVNLGWQANGVPPLENGDRLSRAEFERRYQAMPPHTKAELVEGVVHMPSPVRARIHGRPHGDIMTWLGTYVSGTPGTDYADNSTVKLDLHNEPQPDAILYVEPECGGRIRINDEEYVESAPELVVEVAASSSSIDLGPKKTVYQRNAVLEYLVWRVLDGAIDWFILRDAGYEQVPADAAGVVRSETFPGLWLDRPAMLRRDLAAVLQLVQQGLAAPEHTQFVAGLQAARQS